MAKVIYDLADASTGLDVIEVKIEKEVTIGELKNRGLKSIILMVYRDGGEVYYPKEDFKLEKGDRLILIRLREDLDSDIKLF